MKYSLSICIPARNEEFLPNTVEDILKNKRGDTQVIVGLDGYLPNPPLKEHPDVVIVHYKDSIGQRGITNRCVEKSDAKYILKCDAHVAFEEGFDIKLMELMEEDITMVPLMRNLHVFDWVCPDGHRRYQGRSGVCEECGKPTQKEMRWILKSNPTSSAYRFDTTMHFQYHNDFGKLQKGNLTETMSLQGSCFMLTRDRYWKLNVCDEDFGSWGQQGVEVACKSWLSGGRVLVNRTTYYAHCFRTKGGDFGFPYPISGRQVERARKFSRDLFLKNKWSLQIHPLSWLIEKFKPLPDWHEASGKNVLDIVNKEGESFIKELSLQRKSLNLSSDFSTLVTTPTTSDGMLRTQLVTPPTENLSGVVGGGCIRPHDITSGKNQNEMGRITAMGNIAEMVKNGNITTLALGNGLDEPSIHEAMDVDGSMVKSGVSIPIGVDGTIPQPATITGEGNVGENLGSLVGTNVIDNKHIRHDMSITRSNKKTKGILYYTDNALNMKLAKLVRKYIAKSGLPVTSVTRKPTNFGRNFVITEERSHKTMFKQILKGLEEMKEDIVFLTEHDVLYHPNHFKFTPADKNTFYYNGNYWMLRLKDGFAIHYNVSPLSGLVGYREALLTHFRERMEMIEREGFSLRMGFEPMTHKRIKWNNWFNFEIFMPEFPNVDLAHNGNVTWKRWKKEQFRRQPTFWNEGDIKHIAGWDNLSEILRGVG